MRNFYEILGISSTASQNEIKKAYRNLSKILHPDKPTGDHDKFAELNQAYQVLSDPVAREDYALGRWKPSSPKSEISKAGKEILAHIGEAFSQSLVDGREFNLDSTLRNILMDTKKRLKEVTQKRSQGHNSIRTAKQVIKGLKKKEGKVFEFSKMATETHLVNVESALEILDEQFTVYGEVCKIIEDGGFKHEVREQAIGQFLRWT